MNDTQSNKQAITINVPVEAIAVVSAKHGDNAMRWMSQAAQSRFYSAVNQIADGIKKAAEQDARESYKAQVASAKMRRTKEQCEAMLKALGTEDDFVKDITESKLAAVTAWQKVAK